MLFKLRKMNTFSNRTNFKVLKFKPTRGSAETGFYNTVSWLLIKFQCSWVICGKLIEL